MRLATLIRAIASFSLLAGCTAESATDPATNESAVNRSDGAENPVRLVYAIPVQGPCSSCFSTRGVIEVDEQAGGSVAVDLAYEENGIWRNASTQRIESSRPGKGLHVFENLASMSTEFAVRGYVNGREHWDNNEGRNYRVSGLPRQAALGKGRNIVVTDAKDCGTGKLCVSALVENLSPQKAVRIVWTADDWSTTHVTAASYDAQGGQAGTAERWAARVDAGATASRVEFAVVLEQNGETWDNAFGQNFQCELKANLWSCSGGYLVPR